MRRIVGLVSGMIVFQIGIQAHAALKDGLMLYFSFDKVNGKEVTNEAPNAKLHGTLEGNAAQAPGVGNQGVALNANVAEGQPGSDFVRVVDAPEVSQSKAFTIAAWAKATNFGQYRTILSKTDGGAYALTVEESLATGWVHVNGDYLHVAGTTKLQTDRWYHLALLFDGKEGVIYVDGKEDARAGRAGAITLSGADFMIGAEPSGKDVDPNYPAWHGYLDEFYFYDRALTPAEIVEVMKSPLAVEPGGKLPTVWGALKRR